MTEITENGLNIDAARKIASDSNVTTKSLLEMAHILRLKYRSNDFNLCTIVNGRSGKCSEDCKFCAQSAHYHTEVENYDLIDEIKLMTAAYEAEKEGIHCFSIVTSGRNLTDDLLDKLSPMYRRLKSETNLSLCASHGMLTKKQAETLKALGVVTYHHNLETSRRFYKEICTTHEYDVRIETIQFCQQAGLKVCSGGIIGLGETMADRIELFATLKSLDIKSVPINILMPVSGTPLSIVPPIDDDDILRSLAIARLMLPRVSIRIAGGRMKLGSRIDDALNGGIDALMVGNYLTTVGGNVTDDKMMIKALGFNIG